MSERVIRGALLGHGDMASGMVDAVRHITGCEAEALTPLSNRGLSPEALCDEVASRIGDGPAILFTDLQSGSCGFTARRLCHSLKHLVVISGANLPMLIDFVMHQDEPLDRLVPRLLATGRGGICCTPAQSGEHERSAVSR